MSCEEKRRLKQQEKGKANWRKWGPYLSERAWGTVREDYSESGTAWEHFPHDAARSKSYRWGEDGIAGISDDQQLICFAVSLWNGNDPILKERIFGLTGNEGNHGEDVKEYYYYLDNTPTHSYMKYLYKYPQKEFPYEKLVAKNRQRDRGTPEFELIDTGIFDENRYFDVEVEYAKDDAEDLYIYITVTNRGPDSADLVILPTLWFRNVWAWTDGNSKPSIKKTSPSSCELKQPMLGNYWFDAMDCGEMLFTENETDYESAHGYKTGFTFFKNAFHKYVINGNVDALNKENQGTKVAALYRNNFRPEEKKRFYLRLTNSKSSIKKKKADSILQDRKRETDIFYSDICLPTLKDEEKQIARQAYAGLLWTKQFYYFDVEKWLKGDPQMPKPSASRLNGRNKNWRHLNNADIISMPDKWEYPWYATWDLAFHCLPLAKIDPQFAKDQLILMCREWYMHPNGQLPAYEWSFDDVNPPVHAWAALRVYQIEKEHWGVADNAFLEKVFHKLLLNFTWWVNRKDADGHNIFQGGFLGLDNIGIFDRSSKLPTGGHLEQSDGTSWMAMYCLNMLSISLELAKNNHAYEDLATKFFEHFLYIAHAINNMGGESVALWDDEDGFYYDVLHIHGQKPYHLKTRSIVGLIPLFAVGIIDNEMLDKLPDFKLRMEWFLGNRKDLCKNVACLMSTEKRLLSIVDKERIVKILTKLLSSEEFLSDYGIRSLSKYHKDHPFVFKYNGTEHRVDYEPAESASGLFGGNSNWRGPIWFPINYLLIESLEKFHKFYGDSLKVEYPTGSGQFQTLDKIAAELSRRLVSIFMKNADGKRPVFGGTKKMQSDPNFREHLLFYEYFHGDNGAGLGASHQTGWTALVADLLERLHK